MRQTLKEDDKRGKGVWTRRIDPRAIDAVLDVLLE